MPSIELVGMHYHIGSQITRVEPYLEALDLALALLDRIEIAHGIRFEHINTGGGFAIPYYDRTANEPDTYFEAPRSLDGYAAGIERRLQKAHPDLQLCPKPGRAIAGDTAVLVSRVEAEKAKLVEAEAGRGVLREDWIMVDAGFNTVLEHSSYHWYYRAVVANRCGKPPCGRSASAGRSATAATCTPATPAPSTATCPPAPRSATSSPSSTWAPTHSSA